MIEIMTWPLLESVVRQMQGIDNIEIEPDMITFAYRDHEGDDMVVGVRLVSEEKVTIAMLLPIPESHLVCSMIVSSLYNTQSSFSGSVAYTIKTEKENHYAVLESHVCIDGGVAEAYLRRRFRAFINSINDYEIFMAFGIRELVPDAGLVTQPGNSEFWEALGAFAGGVWRGYRG